MAAEAGKHYNYFRDYDPTIGRYIQSDPLGIAVGTNTFGYVLASPLDTIDPLGLEPPGPYGVSGMAPGIKYNAGAPRTIPVPPDTEKQVDCMMRCLRNPSGQCFPLVITGGSEGAPYHKGPGHPQGRAVDFSLGSNRGLGGKDSDNIIRCAKSCGFDYGWFENWGAPHWHFQRGPGGNVPPLPTPRAR